MAIVIPSSKTYDRQNPKVRDNVIERIEVGAVEAVTDNEYETPVYNGNFLSKYVVKSFTTKETKNGNWGLGYRTLTYSFYKLSPFYEKNIEVKIKKLKENHFIEKIFYSFIKENNEEIPDIKTAIYTKKYLGTINTRIENIKSEKDYDIIYSKPIYNNVLEERYNIISPLLEYTFTNQSGSSAETSKINFTNEETIKSPIFSSDDDYYYLSFTLLVGFEEIKGGGYYEFTENNGSLIQDWEEHKSECIKVIPQQIEITVYGNTIGIDLVDKTVYINGETAKKVHSVEGNELMQTANYMVDKNGTKAKAIDKMYGDTKTDYAKGKETATIRCSISDYYNGDQKVIAIDNSTGKMSFDIGDQVIPMVYGADGKDRPMSTYQDGSPKVFQVLGTKIFYDGAVWQELYLQED